VRRVAVTLRLYGIGYRHVPLMPFAPTRRNWQNSIRIARVPALQLGDGEMLIDSAVILDHLDQVAGPDRSLTPAAGRARRRVTDAAAGRAPAQEKLVAGLYAALFGRVNLACALARCVRQTGARSGFFVAGGRVCRALARRSRPDAGRYHGCSVWRFRACKTAAVLCRAWLHTT